METPISMQLAPTKAHLLSAKLVYPIVRICVACGIDANWVTIFSLVFAGVAGLSLAFGLWWQAILWLLGNGILDCIDGEVARATPMRPKYLKDRGALLDPSVDRVADSFLIIGLGVYADVHFPGVGWIVAIIIAAGLAHVTSSYLRARVESLGFSLSSFRPLTRVTFQVQILLLCLGTRYFPNFFVWGMSWFATVTVGICIFRLIRSYTLFKE